MSTTTRIRTLKQIIDSVATSDGAGVKLRRSIGRAPDLRVDPFLMLDEFSSDDPNDYIAGFPPHPHRGFETVTYMLDGHMRHEDHLGNRGELIGGGAQWMSAGRGIIHSEMPQQEHGRMRGFQLWINLPAREKMKPPEYRDLDPAEIPAVALAAGGRAKVVAGTLVADGARTVGPIRGGTLQPAYFDVVLTPAEVFSHEVPADHNVLAYVYEGELRVGSEASRGVIGAQRAGVLAEGERVEVRAGTNGARFLLLSARPINEPIVQYGPFVMNTQSEIAQAVEDYRAGRFEAAAQMR